jgi:hypothetical protein
MSLRTSILASFLALAFLAAACTDGSSEASQAEIDEYRNAVDGLCQTAATLRQEGPSAAIDRFVDQTHGYLHELIDRVEPLDRAAAAELLETKQRVEIALRDPSFYGKKEVAKRFTDLHNAMARAGAVVGLPRVGCGA